MGIDNALKYTEKPPQINITTQNTQNGVQISVSDNGIGIAKTDKKLVFEPFFRVHTGNLHNVKGFGLGLSYVQKVVHALGGKISVESNENKGSTFHIFLPFK